MVAVIVKCDYCGKEISKKKYEMKRKHHFCNIQCNGKYMYKPNNIVECKNFAKIIIKDVEVLIDKEDMGKIEVVKWLLCFDKSINNYYIQGHERSNWRNRKNIKLHRLIMDCPDGMVVDHINRNTLDNRKQNLRICTHRDNANNKGEYKNNKTGHKHIFKDIKTDRYVCQVKVDGRVKHVKSSKNIDVVIKARDEFYVKNLDIAEQCKEQDTLF